MLTSKEIIDTLATAHTPAGQGRLLHLARKERRMSSAPSAAHRQFVADAQQMPMAQPEPAYPHPAINVVSRPHPGPLQPSEMAWLQRIPADPSTVPHEDAKALAGLAASVSSTQHPADARLIHSVWQPVKEFHDANAAQVDLRNAQQPLPPIPSSALSALAEAIAAETPALRPDEALTRASEAITAASTRRQGEREQAVANAHAVIERGRAAAAQRTAVIPR